MNERKITIPSSTPVAASRDNSFRSIFRAMGTYRQRISFDGISLNVADLVRRVWWGDRDFEESERKVPHKWEWDKWNNWRQMNVVVNLLTLILCASYITLGIFSYDSAEQYIWYYAGTVTILSLLGLVTSGRR